jgi:hypothetical protein
MSINYGRTELCQTDDEFDFVLRLNENGSHVG